MMKVTSQHISNHAICRECGKEFGVRGNRPLTMYVKITKHIKQHVGHTVIGIEQIRHIYKGESCIAR